MAFASEQLVIMVNETDAAIEQNPMSNRGPHVNSRAVRDRELFIIPSRDWTSGFMPGLLWYMYEYTGESYWLDQAKRHTAHIEREKTNATTHDMGFKIYCSFGNGYRLIDDPHYKDVIIEASNTLITRFNTAVGAIRSWDHNTDRWDFPVIIDNMMNLEMLFRATQLTGDSVYYDIAVQHARTTMDVLFRDDFSSYHVAGFNPDTGELMQQHTHQGAFHASAWARGQAWGLYGYVMSYRFTGYTEFLEQAENIAAFILNHPSLPADLVPYWDYDDPNIPNTARDVSAATITASALYELSTVSTSKSAYYKEKADMMLASVYHNFRSADGDNFGFLLEKSTGHLPHGYEIDVPLIYADYYFIEAALRKQRLENL
ncbi:MAG: glycoside hydrolase family 88 protein [Balneolales bacterium]|nr:glycoside hydrolase family 88 protein [Balneolales bacterium]